MGEVYEVEHDLLGTRRALKALVRDHAARGDFAERLRVEARGLARVRHVNLVEVYDLGTAADGRLFFVMELLEGSTLGRRLKQRGAVGLEGSVRLIGQVLDGLHAAHCAGMIHRDVKPENIFVCTDGVVKLLDFGVAKAMAAWMPEQHLTDAGTAIGTPRYMAPEQAKGGVVDARTDVYSAGLVLWECLTGRPAFHQRDLVELTVCKLTQGVPSLPADVAASTPECLRMALQRATQTDPDRRYSSAEAFAADLRGALAVARRIPSAEVVYTTVAADLDSGTTTDTIRDVPSVGDDDPTRLQAMGQPASTRPLAPVSIDREAPTRIAMDQVVLGPGGTRMLPAAMAQRAARTAQKPNRTVRLETAKGSEPSSGSGVAIAQPRGVARAWIGWALTAAAFGVPVLVAIGFAKSVLRGPAMAPASLAQEVSHDPRELVTAPPVTSSASAVLAVTSNVAPEQSASSTPVQSTVPVTSSLPPNRPASSKPAKGSATARASAKAPSPATARVPAPSAPAAKKAPPGLWNEPMPASGL